ncbi:MAG: CCA tRNA nucleotidyltransferase [Hormoscilla sp. GM102CHS1]|nr:CCA tRNA nucleotidyltransferase [Hormoscilla sp. GM102CHS1]
MAILDTAAQSLRERTLNALSPETWPFSLEWLPADAYLVGGAVRDALLSSRCLRGFCASAAAAQPLASRRHRRREYLDLDFVMPADAVKTAKQIASHYLAGFVVLDADRQIARVVFSRLTIDFAQQEGETLAADLGRRDFTINAIAYHLQRGELVDPLGGCADLEAGIIRMVSRQNLQDDPLRLLRAYRQAAQLGFAIEPETSSTIGELAPHLSRVAAERVRVEVEFMLDNACGTIFLQAAFENSLLAPWFPSATAAGLARVAAVDRAFVLLAECWPDLGVKRQASLLETQKTSWLSIAKLASLLNPDPQKAEAELLHLKYSRVELRATLAALKSLPQLQAGPMSLREQYFFFREVGEAFPAACVLAVASGVEKEAISPMIDRYLDPQDPAAHPTALVTGTDLMSALNLPRGRQIGKLLTEIQIAQVEGKVSTAAEALEFAAQLLN